MGTDAESCLSLLRHTIAGNHFLSRSLSAFSLLCVSEVQTPKIIQFWENFLTAKNSKSAKIRGKDRSMRLAFLNVSVFVFFAFFAVQLIW